MFKFFKDVFTGPDGDSIEIAHIIWALGILVFLIVVVYVALHSMQYPTNFGTDFMTINAGGAAGSYARAKADQTLK